jgi:hypothetical protein
LIELNGLPTAANREHRRDAGFGSGLRLRAAQCGRLVSGGRSVASNAVAY